MQKSVRKGFFVGIDGGGTKSRVMVEFEDGRNPVRLQSGPLNLCSTSITDVTNTISDVFSRITELVGSFENCLSVGVGTAGFSNPEVSPLLETHIRKYIGFEVPLVIASDATVALYGAHQKNEGLVLISGTGSVCFGSNGVISHQVGGAGYIIDDGGSGYDIGREILAAVVQSKDGRIGPTVLASRLSSLFGYDTKESIINWVYNDKTKKNDIAAIASLITDACRDNDAAALEIVSRAAERLFFLVETASRILALPSGPLAIVGSVLQREPNVRSTLLGLLKTRLPQMVVCEVESNPDLGAIIMAKNAQRSKTQ